MRRLLLCAVLSALSLAGTAQEPYRWFHHIYATRDDVQTICPDQEGRVWLGTSRGMFRYGDYPDGAQYDNLPDQYRDGVEEITQFTEGRLLIRARNGHLSLFDPRQNQVEGIDSLMKRWGVDMQEGWSMKIQKDEAGILWFYKSGQLYQLMPGQDKASPVLDLSSPIRGLDSDGRYFCAITDSLVYFAPTGACDSLTVFAHGIDFHRMGVKAVLDGDRNIWIGSEQLFRFNSDGTGKRNMESLSPVMDVIRSKTGNVLVATGNSGILYYGKDGSLLQNMHHQPFESGSLSSNNIRSIRENAQGELWVCYYRPVVSVCKPGGMDSPSHHIIPLLQQGLEENIIALAEAPDGAIWLGTDGQGLFVQEHHDGEYKKPLETQPSITALFFDSLGRTWIGTYRNGIYCVDGKKQYHFLPSTACFHFLEDKDGYIWAGTQGNGLFRISPDLSDEPVQVNLRYNRWVFKMAEGDNTIYTATSSGLFTVNPRTLETSRMANNKRGTQAFRNTQFNVLLIDSRGLLWTAGNQSGCPLEIYDTRRDSLILMPELEGQIVKSIVEDKDKNIWLALEKDFVQVIVNYNPSRHEYSLHPSVYHFRIQEPQMNYNNGRAAMCLRDGTLLFGGTSGYRRISPLDFPPHVQLRPTPALSISALIVNDQYSPEDVSSLPGVTLRHTQNDVALVISAQDYTSPFESILYYRLKNKDSAWKVMRDHIVGLPRLTPGHYELEVSCANPDGSLSGQVLPFYVDIQAPWYASAWARLLYILLAITVLGLVVYYLMDRQRQRLSMEKIRQEADKQHQLNEMKLRFFTNISHDFRTPLSLIITPLEACLEEGKKADEKTLRPMYRNAVRLLNLVNQILDFRKLEADSVKLNLSYGNLVPFLRDICSSFVLFADETGRKLSFNSDREDLQTAFDKDKITKIVMNLLSNAFKFAPEGSMVSVNLSARDGDVIISVADNGPGVPDSMKHAVFERFFQNQEENATHIGSGIGLHIVKEFTKLHGGSVILTDNHPTGAVFSVHIPMRDSADAPVQEQPKTPEPALETPAMDGKRILLVEDNADFRSFLSDQLSDEYTVFTAEDGRAALTVLQKEDIDIIISDIMMEGMDGLELCRAVKTNLSTSHIPLILLTAKALAEDEIRGLELGADEYVTKPFHMQILRLRIRKLLERSLKWQRSFQEHPDISPSEITITSLDEQFLTKAVKLTEDNMANPDFSVEKLSTEMGVHRTHLYKKLLSLTGKTPVEFVRLIRLKRAAQYLEKSQRYVSEIAYMVGFNSPKVFARHFKEEFGMTPSEYQEKHGQQ